MQHSRHTTLAWRAFAALALATTVNALATAETLRLGPGVPVVVAGDEPPALRRAAEDLCRDLGWVLGKPSPLVADAPADPAVPAIVVTVRRAGRGSQSPGPESHAIFVRGSRVVLEGADTRGAIYAVYSFSDRFLDVPPWWFWANWKPARRQAVELPTDLALGWKPPQVKWRAWFPNDTDLLSPWIQKDYAARWDKVLETMLRLKLNMIDVGEVSDDSIRKVRTPRDRGVAITTTHLAPFGASLRNWDEFWRDRGETPPALTLANVASLEKFWEHHIRLVAAERADTVWMIGFRGDGDKGFFKTFADAPADDAARARVVEDMMHRQVALLKRVTGTEHPPMRTVLYDECSDYVAAGLLHPPDEESLIWNFTAARRDHFPAADLRQYRAPPERLLGYYFNIQFTSTGSHLADGEGPWKLEKNHRMVLESGPNLALSVVNSGNTREFPLSLHAHAAMMWDFSSYHSDRYLDEFCRRYWGSEHAARIASLYRDFYAAYWQQRKADLADFPRQYIFHDLRIARAARELMLAARIDTPDDQLLDERGMGYYRIVPKDNGAASKLDAVILGGGRSAERFAAVARQCDELSPRLNPQGRLFFDQSLRLQASFMAAASRVMVAAAEGLKAGHDPDAYRRSMQRAEQDAQAMAEMLAAADTDTFAGWYAGEEIFGLKETRDMIDRRASGQIKPGK